MKLGILLPTSKLYPSIMMDFNAGVRMALDQFKLDSDIEIVFESIGQGTDKNQVVNTINKLVIQHQTDVNILFCNVLLLAEISAALNGLQRPLIITNIGGNLPDHFETEEYIFTNSFGLWESAFLGAKWGVKKFGGKVAHGSYFYEAGFRMYDLFCRGLEEAKGTIVFNQVSEFNPNPDDFTNFMKQMEIECPDFLYMLYSERDAVDFLTKLSKSPENGKYPILTSGVMLNDEILNKVEGTPENIFNVASWDISDPSADNAEFKERYRTFTGNEANYFSLLGYECAGAICEAMQSANWSNAGKVQAEAIRNSRFKGPRGEVNFDNALNSTNFEHYVYTLNEQMQRVRIDSLGMLDSKVEIVERSRKNDVPAGWYQPYLCQ